VLAEAIHIVWENMPLLFAYVPFSIANEDLQQLISTWSPSSTIAADFNVDFGTGTIPPTLRGRADRILGYTNKNDMSLLTPSNQPAKWDHLFSSPNAVSQYSVIDRSDLLVRTNHPALGFIVIAPHIEEGTAVNISTDRHYVLSPLRSAKTADCCRDLLHREYSTNCQGMGNG